jgi:hypothetical protein
MAKAKTEAAGVTSSNGTTYTVSGDKVSGTNGLKVPSGTASTAPAPAK